MGNVFWRCKKCGGSVGWDEFNGTTPKKPPHAQDNCSKGGKHSMVIESQHLMIPWTCKKCGVRTNSTQKPADSTCREGGTHQWVAGFSRAPLPWKCNKCNLTTYTQVIPPNGICRAGGGHTWRKGGC